MTPAKRIAEAFFDFAFDAMIAFCAVMIFVCSSCATIGEVRPRSGQEQAVHIAWVEVYKRTDRPPLIRWAEGKELVCTDQDSGKRGFWILEERPDGQYGSVCREGVTWSCAEVLVSWHGELSLSETAMAHELLHAALVCDGILLDHHERPDFYPLVDKANEAIRRAGR